MANETKIGELVIDLKMRLEGVEKGLETAKKKIQEVENQNEDLKKSNDGVEESFTAMSEKAVVALTKITEVINDCVNEYKSYTQAMSSLNDVANYTNQSLDDFSGIMDKFGAYMTKADLATTIKNFSLMGMTAKQTEQMIEALTNSAIRNRNANYTVSEAVKVASEGYRQGLSTLSDSAGVTENLSVMLDNYAKSIGKTASQLTDAERNQAYLNRTMYAAAPFARAMAEYMDTLAGKEGAYNQALRETQVAYAEALEPTLIKITEMKTGLIKLLGQLISSNNEATIGITTFTGTLLILGTTLTVGMKILQSYKKSMDALNISGKNLKITLAGLTATSALVGVISSVITAINKQKEAQEELTKAQMFHNSILERTIELNEENTNSIQTKLEKMENYINDLNKYNQLNLDINYGEDLVETLEDMGRSEEQIKIVKDEIFKWKLEVIDLNASLKKTSDKLKKVFNIEKEGLLQQDDLTSTMKSYNERLEESNAIKNIKNAISTETIKNEQQEASKLQINVNQMQKYLDIIKKENKATTEYQKAEKALAEAYSEASTAEGINIDIAQDCINKDKARAEQAWNTSQENIKGNIKVIETFLDLAKAAANNKSEQEKLAKAIGISYENIIPTLTSVLNILQTMAGYTPTQVPNITPITNTVSSTGGSSSYSNKALDNYKKQIEHKKALDQITLKEEIEMYETALRVYAKTADEKNEIREKIYSLNKELAKKEKDILDQQTEDYENYIQEQKNLRGAAYDVTEQTNDYNKIIKMHKNYLNQIMTDERMSLEERKELYREELDVIRDYEQKKRDLRVEHIDNTVSQLTNAITKQLEEMQKKDKEMIDENLKVIEEWKEARIKAINDEYDARIEAIEKELDLLNKAEKQKTRDEEDAEYERKKKRLEELVNFEHDATTKANYQKELDKLIAEYQKTLDTRALEDKKEALKEQKDLLKEEQNSKTQAIEEEADKQKELYEKQLEELENYYNEQMDKAQETAEKMLLNVEQNQDKILDLLKNYGDAYEITGQSLGEKLAQGINEGVTNNIESIIQRVQDLIDAGIENKLAELASGVYRYEAGSGKSQVNNINITQQNYIEQNPEMPSETYRKLRNINEQLATDLAGM